MKYILKFQIWFQLRLGLINLRTSIKLLVSQHWTVLRRRSISLNKSLIIIFSRVHDQEYDLTQDSYTHLDLQVLFIYFYEEKNYKRIFIFYIIIVSRAWLNNLLQNYSAVSWDTYYLASRFKSLNPLMYTERVPGHQSFYI